MMTAALIAHYLPYSVGGFVFAAGLVVVVFWWFK